jgi:DNA-binding MarR family transcriptional regulator
MKLAAGKAGAVHRLTLCICTVYLHGMNEFSECLVTNTRMAARAITRRYDVYLRPYGLTSTQLSLLASIKALPDHTVSELAEARGFDRTTLTRNLDRLEAMGLIESRAAEKGNGRMCAPTPRGRALIEELVPLWRKAQAELRSELASGGFEASLKVLRRLAKV